MISNIKKYVREFSTVTVTSKCGYKTFAKLDRKGVYRWINVLPNGKLDDPSCEITEQDFVALLEIFSKAGMRVKFNEVEDLLEELEDEAFWLCTARAEKHKGIEMW